MTLREQIQAAINSSCAENNSNTPDFILAQYVVGCLKAFDAATRKRDEWYLGEGQDLHPGMDCPKRWQPDDAKD